VRIEFYFYVFSTPLKLFVRVGMLRAGIYLLGLAAMNWVLFTTST